MSADADSSTQRPVFSRCPRCRYSLRGLPANHACPECGLRYDEDCALYRATNPRAVIAMWAVMFFNAWMMLRWLLDPPDFSATAFWDKFGVMSALAPFLVMGLGIWFLIRLRRRGQEVAITTDGLIIRLPTFDDKLIPWERVGPASVYAIPTVEARMVRVFLLDKNRKVFLGRMSEIFPTRKDAHRFVKQVNERAKGGDAEPGSNDENIPT